MIFVLVTHFHVYSPWVTTWVNMCLAYVFFNIFFNVKVEAATSNQEKALRLLWMYNFKFREGSFEALILLQGGDHQVRTG